METLLDRVPVEKVTSVLDWWTFHHTGTEFIYRTLKIPPQKDAYSCGLLGTNTLFHFYLPDTYLLINMARVNTERVRVLLKVAQ
jgi:hypothetical protein